MRVALRIDFEAEAERGETRAEEEKMLRRVSGMVKGFTDEIAKRAREDELEVRLGTRLPGFLEGRRSRHAPCT